jgi:hypothetical protein
MCGVENRYSMAWVHYMLHAPAAAHRALVQFVAELRRGGSAGGLAPHLRAAVPNLDERMVQHFTNWRPRPRS